MQDRLDSRGHESLDNIVFFALEYQEWIQLPHPERDCPDYKVDLTAQPLVSELLYASCGGSWSYETLL